MIRLPGWDTALPGIDRDVEGIAYEAGAELAIAPPVAVAHDDCLVTRSSSRVP